MHVLEPFLLDVFQTPDHSAADLEQEIKIHYLVQNHLEKFLKGEIDEETFNDCLAQFGVDPLEYWSIVDENIDAIREQGTTLERTELILPGTPEWADQFYS